MLDDPSCPASIPCCENTPRRFESISNKNICVSGCHLVYFQLCAVLCLKGGEGGGGCSRVREGRGMLPQGKAPGGVGQLVSCIDD